jgi:hypothetical protein
MNTAKKKFVLTLKTETVDLGDKEYKLVELTGAQRDLYLADSSRRMKLDAAGKPVAITDMKGLQSFLVSLSLRDPEGKEVPQATIDGWPSATISGLHEIARELSGLGKEEEAAAKKD